MCLDRDREFKSDPEPPQSTSDHERSKIRQLPSPSNRDTSVVHLADTESGDDSFNDGEAAYKQFKERRALKRKRSSANLRKSKKTKVANPDSFVGKRPKKENEQSTRTRPILRTYGEELPSDDELMEYTLPDYCRSVEPV